MKIIEIFHSLQGEGIKIGLPTSFVRTSGCNLRCEWCDTRYAWEGGEEMSVGEIESRLEEIGCQRVCVTGGEPLFQDEIMSLIDALLENYEVSVETNGSFDISDLVGKDMTVSMDYKTPSSGMEDRMLDSNLDLLREKDQLKFVILDREDYEFSVELLKRLDVNCEIIFQPGGEKGLRDVAEWVVEDGLDVRVLPQLHKVIWGEREGV